MSLLLDTNIVLALIEERPDKLGREARRAIEQEQNLLYASVASLWEIAIKIGTGKMALRVSPERLPALLDRLEIDLLSIEADHVLHTLDPLPPTRDPFDRLLLAQCAVENLRLVTLDRALVDHPLAWRPD